MIASVIACMVTSKREREEDDCIHDYIQAGEDGT